MKDKIAFVCQRYGLEVNGGAELYCRQLAEKMLGYYDVEVYTTCAEDYVTWANRYAPGDETLNGIVVHRYPVEGTRDQKSFQKYSDTLFRRGSVSDEEEEEWLRRQGPVCPALLKALWEKRGDYRAILFMTYLYYPTVKGLAMGFDNALFIPTTHDELPIYFRMYDKVFASANGFIWLTPEEKAFAEKRFSFVKHVPGVIAGSGVDVPEGALPELPAQLQGVPYIVYAGRIDESKGCGELFQYFRRYKQQYGGQLKLALMGKAAMRVPKVADIVDLGFVSNEMKFAVMRSARALTIFSHLESLSIVVLESMTMGRPVLVNGACEVLKGHCVRSNAGLYFMNYWEFAGALNYLLGHEQEYAVMCENGRAYVAEHYRWDDIVARIKGLIDQTAAKAV